MGNCFSTAGDNCLNRVFQWLEEKGGYNHNLKNNLDSLEKTMVDLMTKQETLLRRLKREEDRGLKRLPVVKVWLDRVEIIEKIVNCLLSDRDVELQKWYVCGFCYGYGEKVFLTLKEVEELKSEDFEVIADQVLTPVVEERQLQRTVVGQKTMLEKAWEHFMEDGVGMMGMYGMGGIGKTTLLTQINNKFSKDKSGFEFVIWVTVSTKLDVEKIQNEIALKVDLGGEEWKQKDKSQRTGRLFNFLKEKRFVLFLDDIWEKVDLLEIGVPFPTRQNKCKVAFTTRSQDVCSRMEVEDPMEVQCLAEIDALDLFQKKVGQRTLERDPGIPALARVVAKKCCGLPLALNVIGETMSSKKTIQEWEHAIDVLNSYAAQFSGMEDKILPLLKYSYDDLKGEHIKSCLLYCALFPEDARINKETLIDYWMCEGIIYGSEDIEKAEREGYDVIGSLVSASLLMEEVDRNGKGVVSMHDVIREMALWIASDLGIQKEAFIVRAGVGLSKIPKVNNWIVVRRMSLMHNRIEHLAGSPKCPVLTTLLLQQASFSKISSEFFKSMPKLAVLDLSGNYFLYELTEGISNLVSLQYLNLSRTAIRHLPKNLQKLKKLIHLDLEDTLALRSIAGISSLQNLKVLKLYGSGIRWNFSTLDELEALEYLEVLGVGSLVIDCRSPGGEQYLRSQRLMSCTQSLQIKQLESSGILLLETMDKLRKFSIIESNISEIKMGRICSSLVEVDIRHCKGLRELTFLMSAPNLTSLLVDSLHDLEDIINEEKACQVENSSGILPFSKLTKLHLQWLPKLKNIYWSPLPFPCLQTIYIIGSLNLKNLPLDSKSGDNGIIITYRQQKWIKGVEWKDEATKTRFLPLCKQETRYAGYDPIRDV